jgi:hypothetical protein
MKAQLGRLQRDKAAADLAVQGFTGRDAGLTVTGQIVRWLQSTRRAHNRPLWT